MSAQPEEPFYLRRPGLDIPRTIEGISEHLKGEKRTRFLEQVMVAEQGEALNEVMLVWWAQAVFDQNPQREKTLADVRAGRGLVSLEELKRRLDARDRRG